MYMRFTLQSDITTVEKCIKLRFRIVSVMIPVHVKQDGAVCRLHVLLLRRQPRWTRCLSAVKYHRMGIRVILAQQAWHWHVLVDRISHASNLRAQTTDTTGKSTTNVSADTRMTQVNVTSTNTTNIRKEMRASQDQYVDPFPQIDWTWWADTTGSLGCCHKLNKSST